MKPIAALLMMALWGCDSKAASPTPDQGNASGSVAASPSRFLDEIGKQKFPVAKPPKEALSIRFDFSGKKIYAFDYTQQVETTADMNVKVKEDARHKQKMDAKGLLLLKSKGDQTGTLVLKGMKVSMVTASKAGGQERSTEMQQPTMVIPRVAENGSMEGGAVSAQPLLNLLFPMPPNPLKPGESALVPVSFPFNAMGSLLTVKGTSKITYAGGVLIDGKVCARLDIEIDVSQLEVPKEAEGKYACSAKGGAVYYFDVEAQEFVGGDTAILMKMSIESKMPEIKSSDAEKSSSLPKTLRMAMESDNVIRLARNPEVAKAEAEGK
jgi:hypothetical protein